MTYDLLYPIKSCIHKEYYENRIRVEYENKIRVLECCKDCLDVISSLHTVKIIKFEAKK